MDHVFTVTNDTTVGVRYALKIGLQYFSFWNYRKGGFNGTIFSTHPNSEYKASLRNGSKKHAEVSALIRNFLKNQ